jgi:hypothetical protein
MSSPVSTPVLPAPGPQRPIGVVFAAIALALMTCTGFLSAVSVFVTAALVRVPQLEQAPLIEAVDVVMGIVMLLISGYCAWTVVGLFRMKKWARISILVLGGIIAFFSFLCMVTYCVVAFVASSSFASTGTPAVLLR